ncbi:MAG: YesL family protein [Eubacteriales bacterium]|nr:YesL family protein [Eubacteriales bacterium]
MFRNLLNPEGGLMITMGQLTDCIFLSLFWLLGCFPIVTIGTSCAALYDAAYRGFRKGDKHSWQRFWQVFKENWKAGLVPTVLFLVLLCLLGKVMIFVWNAAATGALSWMVFSGAAFLGVTALGILSLTFPVLSRFENSLGGLLKNTLLLALANLPRTIGLGIVSTAAVFLCARFVFPLFFLPALAALVDSLLVEPMFKPFMPQEAEE